MYSHKHILIYLYLPTYVEREKQRGEIENDKTYFYSSGFLV